VCLLITPTITSSIQNTVCSQPIIISSIHIMVHVLAYNTLYHVIHRQLSVVCALTTPIITITSSTHKYGGG
jgi:hypothetical protein